MINEFRYYIFNEMEIVRNYSIYSILLITYVIMPVVCGVLYYYIKPFLDKQRQFITNGRFLFVDLEGLY